MIKKDHGRSIRIRCIKLLLQQTSAHLRVSPVLLVNFFKILCLALEFFINTLIPSSGLAVIFKILIYCMNVIDFCIRHPPEIQFRDSVTGVCGIRRVLLSTDICFLICKVTGIILPI